MKAIVLILLLCVVGVFSHAVLLQPRAWWKTASRTRPCGGAKYNPIPSDTWSVGSRQMLKWWIIAGDGIGVVTGRLNLLGNTNFNHAQVVNLTVEQPERGFRSQGTFYPNITVPNVKCLGPNGTCTLQMSSNGGGGWYSCATINITCAGCDAGKPISGDKCLKAQNLDFCDSKNNQQVLVPLGQTPDEIDELVEQTFRQNHPNPDVFINGNSSECMKSYREMLCELYFTPCGNSTSDYTQQQCDKAIYTQCQLNELHKDLYDCTVFPLGASNSDSSSSVSSLSSSLFVSPFLLFLSFVILLFLWV